MPWGRDRGPRVRAIRPVAPPGRATLAPVPLPMDLELPPTTWRPTWRTYTACLVVVLLVVGAVVAGVLVPYVTNGLHRVPLADVASGAYDPKDLWPSTTGPAGALVRSAGLLALLLGGPVVALAGLLAALGLWQRRGHNGRAESIVGVTVVVLTAVYSAFWLSPWGQPLFTWAMD